MTRTPLAAFASYLSLAVAGLVFTGCNADAYGEQTDISADWDATDDSEEGRRARRTLFVDPDSNAADQAVAWRTSDPDGAAKMDGLADQALSVWVGDWNSDVTDTVDDAITDGGRQLRSIVVYNIPHRDCGFWSAGGAADADEYEEFVSDVAAGIDGRNVLVILEPDALALRSCLSASQVTERESLMADAVTTLTAAGGRVYLDAGDSNWIGATEMAEGLVAANVAGAAGFALNVSHTETTSDSIEFANELRAIVGPEAHYVVDTGRSGLGPTEDNEWCNPLGRATGDLPTLATGVRGLDATLWIKPPGESDGECNGGPEAGAWWPEYALELAELGGI